MSSYTYKSHFDEFKNKFTGNISKTLNAIGIFVLSEMQARCPVKTGNLKGSYTYEVNEQDNSVTMGSPVDYAPHVELGTHKMKAQPHLRPAVESNILRIENIIKENMDVG